MEKLENVNEMLKHDQIENAINKNQKKNDSNKKITHWKLQYPVL